MLAEDPISFPGLKMEGGAVSQGAQAASGSWNSKQVLAPSTECSPAHTLISASEFISDF